MMHFQNFDIVIFTECLCDALHKRCKQIDTEAHIARADDDSVARSGFEFFQIIRRETRCADNMRDAGLGCECSKLHG